MEKIKVRECVCVCRYSKTFGRTCDVLQVTKHLAPLYFGGSPLSPCATCYPLHVVQASGKKGKSAADIQRAIERRRKRVSHSLPDWGSDFPDDVSKSGMLVLLCSRIYSESSPVF